MSELVMNAQYEEGYQDGYAKAKEEYEKELKRRDETLDWLISQSKKLTEVVRCMHCKNYDCVKLQSYCKKHNIIVYPGFYCRDGEK